MEFYPYRDSLELVKLDLIDIQGVEVPADSATIR
jgi:hypothetical protein